MNRITRNFVPRASLSNWTRSRLAILIVFVVLIPSVVGVGRAGADDAGASKTTEEEPVAPPVHPVELKTLDGHFPFLVPNSVEEWQSRAESLRRRVQVATGLYPMPEGPPLDPIIHSPVQKEGFTIEKVFFESLPGHFVTGMLFRPSSADSAVAGNDGKRANLARKPGVLCPHGHGGRMMRYDEKTIQKMIENGDEKYVASGSTAKLSRCAQLARMGCVVFIFDMVGYADSGQLGYEFAHRRHATRAAEFVPAKREPWHFFSAPADGRLQSVMGLQTFNAIRSLDFLVSLPDVDSDRLAVTGGSGGGTQTILLGAIDQRVKVSFPNGMVSTSMQGGCACENTCLLRINTGNVELAALMAPRPMGMTAADDWTRDMMDDGYPELQSLYAMLGVPQNVLCKPLLQFKHNYNYVTRGIMYEWMNEHLGLGLESPIVETDFEAITDDEGAVWNEQYPAPAIQGEPHEREVLAWWDKQNQLALTNALGESATKEGFDALVRPALQTLFDVSVPDLSQVTLELEKRQRVAGQHDMRSGTLTDTLQDRKIPIRLLTPAEQTKNGESKSLSRVVWVDPDGRDLAATFGKLPRPLRQWLEEGHEVLIVGDAEQAADAALERDRAKQIMNGQPRRAAASFTFGYNRPFAVRRCGDVLAAIAEAGKDNQAGVVLVAPRAAVAFALPAASIAGPLVDRAIISTNRFRFGDLRFQDDADFIPGMVKYGDVDALAAWRAPYPLELVGDVPGEFTTTHAIYASHGASNQVTHRVESGPVPTTR